VVLVAKLLLAPAFVVGASLVARRFGARVGGLVAGLPVVGGPILLAITLEHGRSFGAHAATGTLLGFVGLAGFVVAYAWSATRFGPPPSMLIGWAAYMAIVTLLSPLDPSPVVAFAVACLVLAASQAALPNVPGEADAGDYKPPPWDLPVRALAALVLVLSVTTAAGALGPQWSGLLAPFPIITSVLAVFTHHQLGLVDTLHLLRGFLSGFYAYALFTFILAVALPSMSTGAAFGLALAAAIALQIVVALLTSRRPAVQPVG
jgi:hypothetical protein